MVSTASGPSCLRRLDTYPCNALAAVSGGLPSHNSSMSRSLDTAPPACSSRIASSFRCCPPRRATSVSPSRTSSGPRIRYLIATTTATVQPRTVAGKGRALTRPLPLLTVLWASLPMLRPREPQRAVREQGEGDVLVPQDQDSGSDADGRLPARDRIHRHRPGRRRHAARADGGAVEGSPGAHAGDGSLLPPRCVQPGRGCAAGREAPGRGDRPVLPPRKLRRDRGVEPVPVVR